MDTTELLTPKQTTAIQPSGSGSKTINIKDIYTSSFIAAKGVMVALMHVWDENGKEENTLTMYIETEEEDWSNKVMEEKGKNWKTQVALSGKKTLEISSAMVAKNDKIYLLVSSSTENKNWNFDFVVGTITEGSQTNDKNIKWESQPTPAVFSDDKVQKQLKNLFPFNSYAFLTEDGAPVFVVRCVDINDSKNVFLVAHSKNSDNNFEISFVDGATSHIYSFFPWGKSIFMVPELFADNSEKSLKVRELSDMEGTWDDATGPLAEKLNEFKENKLFITTTTIDNKSVLLFIGKTPDPKVTSEKAGIHLYMANNKCFKNMGEIPFFLSDEFTGSLLHTNTELFFYGQPLLSDNFNVNIWRLTKYLNKIKSALAEEECAENLVLNEVVEDVPNKTSQGVDIEIPEKVRDSSVRVSVSVAAGLLLCVLFGL